MFLNAGEDLMFLNAGEDLNFMEVGKLNLCCFFWDVLAVGGPPLLSSMLSKLKTMLRFLRSGPHLTLFSFLRSKSDKIDDKGLCYGEVILFMITTD